MRNRSSSAQPSPIQALRLRNTHRFLRVVLVAAWSASVLAACSPSNSATTTLLTPTAEDQQTGTPSPTPIIPTETATPTPPPPIPDESVWGKGPLDASVQLVVYSDFQCPYCARLMPLLAQLLELHPEELRLAYRHYPLLDIHDKASLAGQAAEAAGAQGAFWSMHDALFDRQQEWIDLESSAFMTWLISIAEELGLDRIAFEDDLTNGEYEQLILDAHAEAVALSIPWTPFMLINGQPYTIETTLNNLEQAVRLALLDTQKYTEYPPMQIDLEREYIAHIHLTIGEVVIQLLPTSAPLAVNNFVFLAGEGWFNGNIFYLVRPGQYVECGDPSALGYGDPGYHFQTEIDPSLDFGNPGMLAMSSLGPNTNGSRFFISLKPLPHLEGTRTIFGIVLSGLELLNSLQIRDPIADLMIPPETVILSVDIEVR